MGIRGGAQGGEGYCTFIVSQWLQVSIQGLQSFREVYRGALPGALVFVCKHLNLGGCILAYRFCFGPLQAGAQVVGLGAQTEISSV